MKPVIISDIPLKGLEMVEISFNKQFWVDPRDYQDRIDEYNDFIKMSFQNNPKMSISVISPSFKIE